MSSLADQLKAIRPTKAQGVRGEGGGLVSRPSLLFTPSEAAELDAEAIYSIGISGLTELCKVDPTLSKFEKTLFIRSGTDFRRENQSPDVIRVMPSCCVFLFFFFLVNRHSSYFQHIEQALDASIRSILRALCPFFLLRPTPKILEYLIRRLFSLSICSSPIQVL